MRLNLAALECDRGIVEKYSGNPLEALKMFQRVTDGLGALARENPLVVRVALVPGRTSSSSSANYSRTSAAIARRSTQPGQPSSFPTP